MILPFRRSERPGLRVRRMLVEVVGPLRDISAQVVEALGVGGKDADGRCDGVVVVVAENDAADQVRGGPVGVVAVARRRRQGRAPGETQQFRLAGPMAGGPGPFAFRGEPITRRLRVETGHLAELRRIERRQVVLFGEPVAVQSRVVPAHLDHGLIFLVEALVFVGAAVVAARERLELRVGHFVDTEVEKARQRDFAQRLVGAPPRFPAGGAHGDQAGLEQLQALAVGRDDLRLQGGEARFLEGEQLDLEFLGQSAARLDFAAVAGVAVQPDFQPVGPHRQLQCPVRRAGRAPVDEEAGLWRICLDNQEAGQFLQVQVQYALFAGIQAHAGTAWRKPALEGLHLVVAAGLQGDADRRLALVAAVHGHARPARPGAHDKCAVCTLQPDNGQRALFLRRHQYALAVAPVAGQGQSDVVLAVENLHASVGQRSGVGIVHEDAGAGRLGRKGDVAPVRQECGIDGLRTIPPLDRDGHVEGLVTRVREPEPTRAGLDGDVLKRCLTQRPAVHGQAGAFRLGLHRDQSGQRNELECERLVALRADIERHFQGVIALRFRQQRVALLQQQVYFAKRKGRAAGHADPAR